MTFFKLANYNLVVAIVLSILVVMNGYSTYRFTHADHGMGKLYVGHDVVRITSFDDVPFFYLPVSINGHKPIMMIVDTGATDTSFSKEDAGRLGLVVDKSKHGRYLARTGNGVVPVEKTQITSLKIGLITMRDVQASVLNTAGDSVLGMSLLGRIGHVDIDGSTLTIRSNAHPMKPHQIVAHYYVKSGGE